MTPRPEPEGLRPPTHCQEDQGWAPAGTVTFYWAQPLRHPEGSSAPTTQPSPALSLRPELLVHGRISTRSCMGAGMCVQHVCGRAAACPAPCAGPLSMFTWNVGHGAFS